MAPILQINDLTKSYGERLLFSDVTFSVNEGDKVGLIAKNGMGKSTLLKIINGTEDYDCGSITLRSGIRVAFLDQTPVFDPAITVSEFIDNFSDDAEAQLRLKQLIYQIGDDVQPDARFATMSGGQRKRIALAATLSDKPDLIILDEPTNHLDIHTIEWLEKHLSRSRVSLLMVTHDRYFLERVCNRIIEIDREQIYSYPGNYDKYLELRNHRIEVMTAELAKVKNTLRKEQEWMSRQPQARAGKAKYRIDAFYDLKERSQVNLSEKNVNLTATSTYIGNKIFHAEGVTKYFDELCVLRDFSYDFARYEKIGIVGQNGVGKSTFVKMLLGQIAPDSGHFDVGSTVRFGYYSQERAVFPPDRRVVDVVSDIADDIRLEGVSLTPLQYLQHFLFSPKDQQKYISNLSGGELSRLYLATVLMRRPNFLILDEPTNDLDIVTLGILEEFLDNFKGCAIIISHDRYFLDNIVDHIFVMEGDGKVRDFPGSYTEYRNSVAAAETKSENTETKTKKEKPRTPTQGKMTYKERMEFQQLTTQIENLSQEKANLEAVFRGESPTPDGADMTACSKRYAEISDMLDQAEMRWLELSEKQ